MAQLVKNPPAMRETWVGSLGWEDPLEKGTATPVFWPGEFQGLVRGVTRSRTRLSDFHFHFKAVAYFFYLPPFQCEHHVL